MNSQTFPVGQLWSHPVHPSTPNSKPSSPNPLFPRPLLISSLLPSLSWLPFSFSACWDIFCILMVSSQPSVFHCLFPSQSRLQTGQAHCTFPDHVIFAFRLTILRTRLDRGGLSNFTYAPPKPYRSQTKHLRSLNEGLFSVMGGDYLLHSRMLGGGWVHDLVERRASKYASIFAEIKGDRKRRQFYLSCLTCSAQPGLLYIVGTQICIVFKIRNSILASPKERKILLRVRTILLRDNSLLHAVTRVDNLLLLPSHQSHLTRPDKQLPIEHPAGKEVDTTRPQVISV